MPKFVVARYCRAPDILKLPAKIKDIATIQTTRSQEKKRKEMWRKKHTQKPAVHLLFRADQVSLFDRASAAAMVCKRSYHCSIEKGVMTYSEQDVHDEATSAPCLRRRRRVFVLCTCRGALTRESPCRVEARHHERTVVDDGFESLCRSTED